MKDHTRPSVSVRVIRHNFESIPSLSSRSSALDRPLSSSLAASKRLLPSSAEGPGDPLSHNSVLPQNTYDFSVPLTGEGLGINVHHADDGTVDGHGLVIHR